MKKLARTLSLLALGTLGLVACNDEETAPAETEIIRSDFAAAGESCGEYRRRGPGGYPMRVEVLEGNVHCRVVQRVLKNHYHGRDNSPWTCLREADRLVECEKRPGMVIRARVFCREWARDRAHCLNRFGEPSAPGPTVAVDVEAGVRFSLNGGVLTVRLGGWAPTKTRQRVAGERIRATCGDPLASPPGDPRREARTRFWPASRARVRYRFHRDMARIARWCRLEHPADGHVAFVRFG
jgi:hypothetical protein